MELKPLAKTVKIISHIQIEILQHLCRYPGSTVYDIYKKRALSNDVDVRSLRRYISDLSEHGLINRVQRGNSKHKAKPCTVTTAGIIYLIFTRNILYKSIITDIFKNYDKNILFKQFLYPLITPDSLLRLRTFNSLSPIELFLYDCCRELVHTLKSINTAKYRYATELIFVWQNIPHNKLQTSKLLDFLKQKFSLSWLDNIDSVKISKNGNELIISNTVNAIFITLDKTNTKAILRTRGQAKYEFIVEVHSPDNFVVLAPCEPIEEINAFFLDSNIKNRIPGFIFNLLSNVVAGSSDMDILSHDKRFIRAVEKTKKKFNNQYERFVKR